VCSHERDSTDNISQYESAFYRSPAHRFPIWDRLVQLFLVSGRLLQYRVSRNSFLHQKGKEINLMDSYVCSGYLAALALRRSEYNPQTPSVARRYSDGFEVDDPEEHILFTIWYRTKKKRAADYVPSLSSKHKLAVFRTRSRVERDAWCWALGCEIEKLVRANKEREAKMRDAGGLVEISDLGNRPSQCTTDNILQSCITQS